MPKYEVTFVYETSHRIEVEAESEELARDLATDQMNGLDVDRLPEMWPSDFEYDSLEVIA
jgi:hypothetical protein